MKVEVEARYPLAPLQEGLLFHTLADPGGGAYVNQLAFPVNGPLDDDAFVSAWEWLIARHDVFRTAFSWKQQRRPRQSVLSRVPLPLDRQDWRGLASDEREARLAAYLEEDRGRGFDVARPPLLRVALLRMEENRTYVVKTHHHLILDGWSSAIVRRELLAAYASFSSVGRAPDLPPAGAYRAYVEWLRRRDLGEAERFWRATFAGLPEPTCLRGVGSHSRAGPGRKVLDLDAATRDALEARARDARVTMNTLVQAAWAMVLARCTGDGDVAFGTTVSGRPPELAEADRTVGLFINTLPVRIRIDPRTPLAEWLREIQGQAARARSFDYAPLGRVQSWAGSGGRALFDTLVVFENYPGQPMALSGEETRGATEVVRSQSTHYSLTLIVLPSEGLRMDLAYDGRVLDAAGVFGVAELLRGTFEALADTRCHTTGEALERSARASLRSDAGAPASTSTVSHGSLPEAFRRRAQETPEAPAIVTPQRVWSYREVDEASDRIAAGWCERRLQPEERVGIALGRSPEAILAILGTLKAGGVYVPLDPTYPAARLELMRRAADVHRVVVGGQGSESSFGSASVSIQELRASSSPDVPLPRVDSDQLAYVVFTSGSTGTPKAVGVSHGAVVGLVTNPDYATLGPGHTLAHGSTLSFDAATFEIWGALLTGGALRPLSPDELLDAERLEAIFRTERIDGLFLTTALFQHYVRARPEIFDGLTQVLFGGEQVDPKVVRDALERRPGSWLRHVYGPTEVTTFATWQPADRAPADGWTIPIGLPIVGTTARVVDRWGWPVPAGVVGELVLGGSRLARGYLGRGGDTAEVFVPDPQSRGGRGYRTGDLVRRNRDGSIEFVGRRDGQVKIRGFRIEPSEVEATLRALPGVADAAVVVVGEGQDRRLDGFVVCDDEEADVGAMAHTLAGRLPGYMRPAHLERLGELPLGPTGKVDRRALAERATRGRKGSFEGSAEAPRNRLEQIIADVWAEILGREAVGIHEDFFDLGGHSLLAVQAAEQVRSTVGGAASVPLTAIFQARTVAELAAVHAGTASTAQPIVPLRRGRRGMPPLVCIHPAGGHVTGYRRLARSLPRPVPVLGVQARALLDPTARAESIEEMAADYVSALCDETPVGPYRLLGWSMGGVVALAMARLLEDAGKAVEFVALVDTSLRVARGGDAAAHESLVDRYAAQLGAHPEHEALARLSEHERARLESTLAGIASDEEKLAAALRFAQDQGLLSRHVSPEVLRIRAAALEHAAQLVNGHAARAVRAPLYVWLARSREEGALASEDWGRLTSGGAQVRVLDEDHASIVESDALVEGLRRILAPSP